MFLNNWGEISTGVDKYIRCLCNFFLQNVITNIIIVGLLLCIKFGDGYHLCQWSTCFRQFIKNVDYVCDEIMFCFSFMAVTFFGCVIYMAATIWYESLVSCNMYLDVFMFPKFILRRHKWNCIENNDYWVNVVVS